MTTLDHVGFGVADYEQGKVFYEKALAPLGMTLLMSSAERPPASARLMAADLRSSSRPMASPCAGGFTSP